MDCNTAKHHAYKAAFYLESAALAIDHDLDSPAGNDALTALLRDVAASLGQLYDIAHLIETLPSRYERAS